MEKSECGGIVMWSSESALLCFEDDGLDVSITIGKEATSLPTSQFPHANFEIWSAARQVIQLKTSCCRRIYIIRHFLQRLHVSEIWNKQLYIDIWWKRNSPKRWASVTFEPEILYGTWMWSHDLVKINLFELKGKVGRDVQNQTKLVLTQCMTTLYMELFLSSQQKWSLFITSYAICTKHMFKLQKLFRKLIGFECGVVVSHIWNDLTSYS